MLGVDQESQESHLISSPCKSERKNMKKTSIQWSMAHDASWFKCATPKQQLDPYCPFCMAPTAAHAFPPRTPWFQKTSWMPVENSPDWRYGTEATCANEV